MKNAVRTSFIQSDFKCLCAIGLYEGSRRLYDDDVYLEELQKRGIKGNLSSTCDT
jgi:hypothetical protein